MILMLGFSRADSARFSFLLSIPAIAGAGIFEAKDAFRMLGASAIPSIAVGTAVAAVTGYASIAWLIKWLGSNSLVGFAVYRIACGVALLGSLAAGFLRRV
jgi:undecaprenyl-diphosphatase